MPHNNWQTPTIRLRAIEPADAETFYRWNLDSERARMLDFVWPPTSLAAVQAWAEEKSKRKLENEDFHWVIEALTAEGHNPVGSISTHSCNPRTGNFSYGVDVAAEHRGQGYASEAIQLVLRYYFDELRYQKCTVSVHADNPASLRLHEKLGFLREGQLRRMIYTQGRYIDEVIFGITVEEFHEKYGNTTIR